MHRKLEFDTNFSRFENLQSNRHDLDQEREKAGIASPSIANWQNFSPTSMSGYISSFLLSIATWTISLFPLISFRHREERGRPNGHIERTKVFYPLFLWSRPCCLWNVRCKIQASVKCSGVGWPESREKKNSFWLKERRKERNQDCLSHLSRVLLSYLDAKLKDFNRPKPG